MLAAAGHLGATLENHGGVVLAPGPDRLHRGKRDGGAAVRAYERRPQVAEQRLERAAKKECLAKGMHRHVVVGSLQPVDVDHANDVRRSPVGDQQLRRWRDRTWPRPQAGAQTQQRALEAVRLDGL